MLKICEQITPETWGKGEEIIPHVIDGKGNPKRCAIQWIWDVYQNTGIKIQRQLRDSLGVDSIVMWNDAPERTFEEVKEAFRKADL